MKISLPLRVGYAAIMQLPYCDLYSGTIPATGDTAPTGTLRVSFSGLSWDISTAPDVCAVAGLPLVSDAATSSGTVGYARFHDGGTVSIYCTIGTGSGEVRLSTVTAASGGTLNMTACSFTLPAT